MPRRSSRLASSKSPRKARTPAKKSPRKTHKKTPSHRSPRGTPRKTLKRAKSTHSAITSIVKIGTSLAKSAADQLKKEINDPDNIKKITDKLQAESEKLIKEKKEELLA